MKNVLIICTANKTRSVMAMEIAKNITVKRNKQYFFQSAGIAVIGSNVDSNVLKVLMENGIRTEHVPTHISCFNIDGFDEAHVMTDRQKTALCTYYKDNKNLSDKINVLDIEDPFGKGIDAYRDCFDKLNAFYKEYII